MRKAALVWVLGAALAAGLTGCGGEEESVEAPPPSPLPPPAAMPDDETGAEAPPLGATPEADAGAAALAEAAAEAHPTLAVDPALVAQGEELFEEHMCATCHWVKPPEDTSIPPIGPPLYGLYEAQVRLQSGETVTADEAYLAESIVDPEAKKAAGYYSQMVLMQTPSEEETEALVAYIQSLRDVAPKYEMPE